MNLPKIIETRKSLEAVLTECSIILGAYKNIIMADKAVTAKLGDEALKHVGILNRHMKRLERDIAEMDRQENAICQGGTHGSSSGRTEEETGDTLSQPAKSEPKNSQPPYSSSANIDASNASKPTRTK